jgi:hypothetical protein
MSDIYPKEGQPVEQVEPAPAGEKPNPEAHIAQAEPAKPEQAAPAPPSSDASEMKAQVPGKTYNDAVEADNKVAQATQAGDAAQVSEASEQAALKGQMTDTPHFHQDGPDCLLQSGRMAEARQTGKDPGLETIKDEAIKRDAYNNKGTDLKEFTNQMNDRPGLQANLQTGTGLEDIKTELDKGNSVIGIVDGGAFYEGYDDGSGHAVVVTGAEKGNDSSWKLTVNDPNEFRPNTPVDENVFKNAWNAMDNKMIVVSKKGGA